jgi:hypothetical protein
MKRRDDTVRHHVGVQTTNPKPLNMKADTS